MCEHRSCGGHFTWDHSRVYEVTGAAELQIRLCTCLPSSPGNPFNLNDRDLIVTHRQSQHCLVGCCKGPSSRCLESSFSALGTGQQVLHQACLKVFCTHFTEMWSSDQQPNPRGSQIQQNTLSGPHLDLQNQCTLEEEAGGLLGCSCQSILQN